MHCPQCHRNFKDRKSLLSHMNQPLGSCFGYIREVVSLADQLKKHKKRHRPQQDIESESEESTSQQELEPATDMDIFMDCDTMDIEEAGSGARFVQEYDGAARTFGPGTTFMQQFERDEFTEERMQNLYYPFTSRAEWELAAFLLGSDLSLAALDKFLSLNLVSPVAFNLTMISLMLFSEDKRPEFIISHRKKASRAGRNASKGPRMALQTLGDNISDKETTLSVLSRSLGVYSVNSLSPPCQRFYPILPISHI
jgi:uncharacterized C2H2 Zn-finger protein